MLSFITVVALGLAAAQQPQDTPLPFGDSRWELQGERTAIVKDGGRDVLQVETGFAHRRDVRFQDGTIDFDVQVSRRRSFVYVYFRAESDGEREEFYLRPHKSALPDALQYAPVWQGRSAWQLYHGPGGTAAVAFEPGVWTHVRIVVQGVRAALFLGDLDTPVLVVPKLARDPKPGFIAVGGFIPADTAGSGPAARFANVVIRPGVAAFDFTRAAADATTTTDEDVVRTWAVSQAFAPEAAAATPSLPDAKLTGPFTPLQADPGGLLPLHRHVRVPQGSRLVAAVARVQVRASRAGVCTFDLGFSDIATAFLNGRPLAQFDASYSFDRPRREGLIGFDQARLFLPLTAGDNELAILVADGFGGWGVMGRFVGCDGISVSAR